MANTKKRKTELSVETVKRMVGDKGKKGAKGKKHWTRQPRAEVAYYDGTMLVLKLK